MASKSSPVLQTLAYTVASSFLCCRSRSRARVFRAQKTKAENIFHTGKYKSLHQNLLCTNLNHLTQRVFTLSTSHSNSSLHSQITGDAQTLSSFFISSVLSAGENQTSYSCTRKSPELDPRGPDPSRLDPGMVGGKTKIFWHYSASTFKRASNMPSINMHNSIMKSRHGENFVKTFVHLRKTKHVLTFPFQKTQHARTVHLKGFFAKTATLHLQVETLSSPCRKYLQQV